MDRCEAELRGIRFELNEKIGVPNPWEDDRPFYEREQEALEDLRVDLEDIEGLSAARVFCEEDPCIAVIKVSEDVPSHMEALELLDPVYGSKRFASTGWWSPEHEPLYTIVPMVGDDGTEASHERLLHRMKALSPTVGEMASMDEAPEEIKPELQKQGLLPSSEE